MAPVDQSVFVPAPDLPPGSRSALVIATSTYADSQLGQLRSPVKDAEDLAAVLADPAIGGFKVTTLIDQTESRLRREIAAFAAGRGPDETVLVYLSCHGIQDARGRLLFAATDTDVKYPHATTVRATDLLDELYECRAQRQILILDCCFSGSFNDGKDGHKGELDLERQLRGHSRGREVLTASRGFEYSFEGEPLDGEITGSVFTTGLVEALRSGAADVDKDGYITVGEAYEYAFGHVLRDGAAQTPQRWLSNGEGAGMVLARSASGRLVTAAKLPEHMVAALESPSPNVRIGGVNTLAEWLTEPDPARQLAALRALEEEVEKDVRRVGDIAESQLERMRPAFGFPAGQLLAAAPERADWIPSAVAGILSYQTTVIEAMQFSPDGAFLAIASDDGTTQLQDVTRSGHVRVLFGHDGPVSGLAFSPDARLLATTGDDGTARLWDVATGGQALLLEGHAGRIRGRDFSPNGALLATTGDEGTTLLWDVASGGIVRALDGRVVGAWGAEFSPDSALLVTANDDGTAWLWDVAGGRRAHVVRMEDGISSFTLSADGGRLALTSQNGTVVLLDVKRVGALHVLRGHDAYISISAFSPDGALLATVSDDGSARLWDVVTGAQVDVLEGHAGGIGDVEFSPDGTLIATAGDDCTVRIWDAATGEQLRLLHGHTDRVFTVAFSPTKQLLASCAADGTVRLWR
jgi:WD40 repeat protein